jgi:hypothetical protein
MDLLLGKFIGIAVGIAFFAVALISARWSRPTFNPEGDLMMRYCPLIQLIANLLGFGYPSVALVFFLVVPLKGDCWFVAMIAGPLGFFVVEVIFFQLKFHRIVVNGEGIRNIDPFRKTVAYAWRDIIEVTYKSRFEPFVFHGKDGQHIAVSSLMTGISLLIEVFKTQLDPKKYEKAAKGIDWSHSWIQDRWGPNGSG